MEKEFVPYELAMKLKDLGFDEPCLFYFNKQENNLLSQDLNGLYCRNSTINIEDLLWGDVYDSNSVTAPLWQQAFDWCLSRLRIVTALSLKSRILHVCFYSDIEGVNCMVMETNCTEIPVILIDGTKYECLEKLIEMIE